MPQVHQVGSGDKNLTAMHRQTIRRTTRHRVLEDRQEARLRRAVVGMSQLGLVGLLDDS